MKTNSRIKPKLVRRQRVCGVKGTRSMGESRRLVAEEDRGFKLESVTLARMKAMGL